MDIFSKHLSLATSTDEIYRNLEQNWIRTLPATAHARTFLHYIQQNVLPQLQLFETNEGPPQNNGNQIQKI